MTLPSRRLGYSNNQLKLLTGYKSVSDFRKSWFPEVWNYSFFRKSNLAFGSVKSFFGIKGAYFDDISSSKP